MGIKWAIKCILNCKDNIFSIFLFRFFFPQIINIKSLLIEKKKKKENNST